MREIARVEDVWLSGVRPEQIAGDVLSFLDMSTTSMGRATHYNTREKQMQAEAEVHGRLFGKSRDLYQILLLLPGTTDRARQIGMSSLLGSPRDGSSNIILDAGMERQVLEYFVKTMPVPRMMKLFDAFRGVGNEFGATKSNNARTRKLILRTLLNSPRIELWSIKYRERMKRVLSHAWGQSLGTAIGKVCSKFGDDLSAKEKRMLNSHVFKYIYGSVAPVPGGTSSRKFVVAEKRVRACMCIAFLYGMRTNFPDEMKLLSAFFNARRDLGSGLILPTEVIEGIRSTFHKDVSAKDLLRMRAKGGQIRTKHEKKAVQKRAAAAGVSVEMNPLDYSAEELYIYAFENGADEAVLSALDKKAKDAADMLPFSYGTLSIVVDASKSMEGSEEQRMRPLAVALSTRDMLRATAEFSSVIYCGGAYDGAAPVKGLVGASGSTSLAQSLFMALTQEPEAVYVISDGYENAPAGRYGDVLKLARQIGVDTPVVHCNPVFAAEKGAVRALCEGVPGVTTMPVKSPAQMGTTMLRGIIEADPKKGIEGVMKIALKNGETPLAGLLKGG